jgi:hypothetical protein
LAALARGLDGHAARVDDAEVGRRGIDLNEPAAAQQGRDLLALVLVDFATQRLDAKRFHETTATNFAAHGTIDKPVPTGGVERFTPTAFGGEVVR